MLSRFFGGAPEGAKVLANSGVEDALLEMIGGAEDFVTLVTPYATMAKLSTHRRKIRERLAKGVSVRFVVRNEADQVQRAVQDLKELCEMGLELYAVERLHAKVYLTEKYAIIGSANLLDSSFDKSIEIGLRIPHTESIYDDVADFVRDEIENRWKDIGPKRKNTGSARAGSGKGHCIRCGESIRMNRYKPLCKPHYASWAEYQNPDYPEKFCHRCGKPADTSMERPLCRTCFKAGGGGR